MVKLTFKTIATSNDTLIVKNGGVIAKKTEKKLLQ